MSDLSELQSIWEDCWQRIAKGEATPEECFAQYPQYADALRRMFAVARQFSSARAVTPSSAFKKYGREELMEHMRAHPRTARRAFFPPAWRLAFMAMGVILLIFVSGTVLAQAALPGEPLYNWKLGSEQVFRAVYPDRLQADLIVADRRANELATVAGNPKAEHIAAESYQQVISELPKESTSPAASATVVVKLTRQKEQLREAGVNVPKLDQVLTALPPAPPDVASGELPETATPAAAPTLRPKPTRTPSPAGILTPSTTPTPAATRTRTPRALLALTPTPTINPCLTPTPPLAGILSLLTPTPTPSRPNPCLTPGRQPAVQPTFTFGPLPLATSTPTEAGPEPTETPPPAVTSDPSDTPVPVSTPESTRAPSPSRTPLNARTPTGE